MDGNFVMLSQSPNPKPALQALLTSVRTMAIKRWKGTLLKAKRLARSFSRPSPKAVALFQKPLNWPFFGTCGSSHLGRSKNCFTLPPTPRSVDRTRSLVRVSEKREYFKCRPETIGDFAPKLFELGV